MTTRRAVAGCAVAVALAVSGCGSSDSSSTSVDSAAEASSDFNDDDVMFAQMMIPHHEQAIEMSDIALDPAVGASEIVRDLATRIKGAQDPEIAQMTALLSQWGQPLAMDESMDHSSMMSGMLSLEDLASLSQTRGTDFDRAWVEAMIAHHEGAIDMAEDVLDSGVNGDIRALAEAIMSGQQAEIDEMKELLG